MFPSCCLVSVDGVNECILNDVQNSGKMNTFLGIFAGVNECSFVQNSCLSQLDLAILWLKVVKNYGVAKIRVFLGRIFGVSLAQVVKKHGVPEICVFLGRILAFLWCQVAKKHGVPKICVFLGRIFGISLASGSKETWCSRNSFLSGYSNFVLCVSSLARVVNWK